MSTDVEGITIDTNATYRIVGVHSGKCVEVAGGTTTSLAQLQIATCVTEKRQQFRLESMGRGYYRLRNVNSGLCADVEGYSTSDGARVIQYAGRTGYNQQWSITDVATGIERLTPRHSGKALDVNGWGTANGTRVQQWAEVVVGASESIAVDCRGASVDDRGELRRLVESLFERPPARRGPRCRCRAASSVSQATGRGRVCKNASYSSTTSLSIEVTRSESIEVTVRRAPAHGRGTAAGDQRCLKRCWAEL